MIETKLITLIWMKNDETNMVMWVLIWKWDFLCDMKQIYWRMLGICRVKFSAKQIKCFNNFDLHL